MATEQRLIDANEIPYEEYYVPDPDSDKQWDYKKELCVIKPVIDAMPTVDAVPVVRCEDCRRWEQNGNCRHGICLQEGVTLLRWKHDFCSYGERRTDNG